MLRPLPTVAEMLDAARRDPKSAVKMTDDEASAILKEISLVPKARKLEALSEAIIRQMQDGKGLAAVRTYKTRERRHRIRNETIGIPGDDLAESGNSKPHVFDAPLR